MSQIMTDEPVKLTDDDVMAWLKANPKFLTRNPGAAELLIPPTRKDNDKKIADFQSYMIKRLKDDREDIIQSAQDIVQTSRANMNTQTRIQNAVLLLLEAGDFQDFIHTMTMDFASLLNVDIVSLVIEIDDDVIPQIDMTGVRVVGAGTIDLLTRKHQIVMEPAINGLNELYGGGATLVKSQLLLRLSIADHLPRALLAFGSRDPNLFQPGMGTEQIAFLGRVVERCFWSWLSRGA